MRKKLTVAEPPKTSHQFLALPLSIIFTSEKDILNWYYSNFIQIYTARFHDENVIVRLYDNEDQNDYEPLQNVKISGSRLQVGDEIIEMYKRFIDNEYYIYTFCDDAYISTMNIIVHRMHDILIHGYDDETENFNVYAYNGPKLVEFNVSYEDFIKAYESDFTRDYGHLTVLYKKKNQEFNINIEKIKWHLLDYYEGVNTLKRERPYGAAHYKAQWGIKIYDELIHLCDLRIQKNRNIGMAEIYCFYEHKKDMVNRVRYLNEHTPLKCTESILKLFEETEKSAKRFANFINKIKMKGYNTQDFEKIEQRIKHVEELDKEALSRYIEYNKEEFKRI